MWHTPSDFIFLLSNMLISLLGDVFKGKSFSSEEKYLSHAHISLDFAPHFVSLETMEYSSLGIRAYLHTVNKSSSYKSTNVQKTWLLVSLLTVMLLQTFLFRNTKEDILNNVRNVVIPTKTVSQVQQHFFLHAPFPLIAHTEVELILAKSSDHSFSNGLICSSFSQIIFRQEREDVLDESNLT